MARDDQDSDSFFLGSDELKAKVVETHAPGVEEHGMMPVLSIAEDIITRLAKPVSADITNLGAENPSHVDESTAVTVAQIAQDLESPINYASYVMHWICVGGVDQHSLTMELLKSLSNYSWDAKAVITYAAFAISYGEFWLLHQLQKPKDQLAGSIATLMGLPSASGELEMETKAVLDVLSAVLKVTHCIIEFKEIPSVFVSRQSPEIPMAVYWIIRSLLHCASTITNLFADYDEYISKSSATSKSILLNHEYKLSAALQSLEKQLKICKDLVEDDRKYNVIQKSIRSGNIDSIEVVSALIHSGEDQTPLYDVAKRTKEGLQVLRQKHVLLLISDLEFPPEELHVFHKIHNDYSMRRVYEYEVLWLPCIDPTTPMTESQESQFRSLSNIMPWYSVEHPSLVHRVAIKFIREDLHFTHLPMAIALEPHGKLSLHDALPMMWIWGANAFPFTKDREMELWEMTEWNINLIVDNVDPRISEWMDTNKVICLYGGDDINWIRKFTKAARTAAGALNVPLEMLYVGKRNPKEKVRLCHEFITRENLSHVFAPEYYDYVWFFWLRLAGMWNSKKRSGRTADDDRIMKGVLDLLTYDSSEPGWAVFSRGNHEITMANGDKLLPILERYTQWGSEVDHPDEFVNVLNTQLIGHCTRLILPGITGPIPEMVVCADCGKILENYVMPH